MEKCFVNKVSIIVPVYNEEGNILILLDKIDAMFKKFKIDGEVVLVNDGSTDLTAQQIKECSPLYPFLKVIEHPYNMGLSQSLTDGFLKSTGQIQVFFPADLQYSAEDIPKLLSRLEEGYDIVTGWKQGYYNKRFVSGIYNYLSRKLFHINVHDLNSIKAIRRKVTDSLILSYGWHRYLVVLAATKGFKIGEVKVDVYSRKYGKSKFGLFSILIGIIDLIIVKIYTIFSKKPSLLFGLMSSIFFVSGLVILGAVFINFFIDKAFLMGVSLKSWLLFITILFMAGILFILVGYIIELITHLEIRLAQIQEYLREKK